MKTEISLNGAEIRQACRQYLEEKLPNKPLGWHSLYYLNDSNCSILLEDKEISYIVEVIEE